MDRNTSDITARGSYFGQARKSLWIETTFKPDARALRGQGQARKSLWIETSLVKPNMFLASGQARKSLWIETELSVLNMAK